MAMVEDAKADFGLKIKQLREARGVTLRQIADATKISVAALDALERNDMSRLPGGIFSRSFVRAYAIEVGLDPERTVRDFLVQFPQDSLAVGNPHTAQHAHGGPARRRQTGIAIIIGVALVIVTSVVLLIMFAWRA
jgi:cytoskeletal protein RodZ